jgi:hypothetical protein
MQHARSRRRNLAALVACVAIVAAIASSVSTASVGAVERPGGAGKPPAGTGIGTQAALDAPMCDATQGPYGKLDWGIKGGLPVKPLGPICVAPWAEGKDNGGATYGGVTKGSVKVVILLPNSQQMAYATRPPVNQATGMPGTVENAFKDAFAPYQAMFETYGRDVEVEYVTSTGDDEASQRADALEVLDRKPFIVADGTYTAHGVFETAIASAKVVVYGPAATSEAVRKQAPYRWGGSSVADTTANLAEFVGKQLVGKKARWAGDSDLQGKTRKFGLVSIDGVIEEEPFARSMAKYKLQIAETDWIKYPPGPTGTTVDTTVAQEQAPLTIQRLKADGVTSVILFTTNAMTTPLLEQATRNEYYPEWIITGYSFMNHPILSRTYDKEQWPHAFGISVLPPTPAFVTGSSSTTNVVNWYWGEGSGTADPIKTSVVHWIMKAIMYAGPNLTPHTIRQGWDAIPVEGGAADNEAFSMQSRGADFNVQWWDPETMTPAYRDRPAAAGTMWYLEGAERYTTGTWPTKPLQFFDQANAVQVVVAPEEVKVSCPGCPSETGTGGSSTG